MPPRIGNEDLSERLARVEEQLRSVAQALEQLTGRDTDLDQGIRALADRLQAALSEQAHEFREAIDKISSRFATREDMSMVKGLIIAAVGALSAYAFHRVTGGM